MIEGRTEAAVGIFERSEDVFVRLGLPLPGTASNLGRAPQQGEEKCINDLKDWPVELILQLFEELAEFSFTERGELVFPTKDDWRKTSRIIPRPVSGSVMFTWRVVIGTPLGTTSKKSVEVVRGSVVREQQDVAGAGGVDADVSSPALSRTVSGSPTTLGFPSRLTRGTSGHVDGAFPEQGFLPLELDENNEELMPALFDDVEPGAAGSEEDIEDEGGSSPPGEEPVAQIMPEVVQVPPPQRAPSPVRKTVGGSREHNNIPIIGSSGSGADELGSGMIDPMFFFQKIPSKRISELLGGDLGEEFERHGFREATGARPTSSWDALTLLTARLVEKLQTNHKQAIHNKLSVSQKAQATTASAQNLVTPQAGARSTSAPGAESRFHDEEVLTTTTSPSVDVAPFGDMMPLQVCVEIFKPRDRFFEEEEDVFLFAPSSSDDPGVPPPPPPPEKNFSNSIISDPTGVTAPKSEGLLGDDPPAQLRSPSSELSMRRNIAPLSPVVALRPKAPAPGVVLLSSSGSTGNARGGIIQPRPPARTEVLRSTERFLLARDAVPILSKGGQLVGGLSRVELSRLHHSLAKDRWQRLISLRKDINIRAPERIFCIIKESEMFSKPVEQGFLATTFGAAPSVFLHQYFQFTPLAGLGQVVKFDFGDEQHFASPTETGHILVNPAVGHSDPWRSTQKPENNCRTIHDGIIYGGKPERDLCQLRRILGLDEAPQGRSFIDFPVEYFAGSGASSLLGGRGVVGSAAGNFRTSTLDWGSSATSTMWRLQPLQPLANMFGQGLETVGGAVSTSWNWFVNGMARKSGRWMRVMDWRRAASDFLFGSLMEERIGERPDAAVSQQEKSRIRAIVHQENGVYEIPFAGRKPVPHIKSWFHVITRSHINLRPQSSNCQCVKSCAVLCAVLLCPPVNVLMCVQ